ncbi:hypothetical protein GOP47_0025748 [Adiantum capillus-veneris]|uniref:Uncharacterized protein n=1 Tax=Adiantum capillus-veneris TaxID=13818 RepID=A0A9D4U2N1_ADICA|nr:hypothetical protein GOP47_0025748 [Adiantum capillus-veneris]
MESVTPNEIAGFCVGAFIVLAAAAAPQVDLYIAQSQRTSLKLCLVCGGLRRVHCVKCKGRGRELPDWTSSLIAAWNRKTIAESPSSPCIFCQGFARRHV